MIPFRLWPRIIVATLGDMIYSDANGNLTPVSGTKAAGKVPVLQSDLSVAWTAASLVRTTVTIAVPATASGAWATGSVAAVKSGCLFLVEANQSCAVRLYN